MTRFTPRPPPVVFAAALSAASFIHTASAQQGACGTTTAPLPLNNAVTVSQCKAAAIEAALTRSGAVQLALGDGCAIDRAVNLPGNKSVVIDGGGVTMSPAGRHRVFEVKGPGRQSRHVATLQNMTLAGGYAPRGQEFKQDPENPHCAFGWKDGSAGAVHVRGAGIQLINVNANDNHAAPRGPDITGGVLAAFQSPKVCVIGGTWKNNTASNGGAIGVIHSQLHVIGTQFRRNLALGDGGNRPHGKGCKRFNHDAQVGSGGVGSQIYADGMLAGGGILDSIVCQGGKASMVGGCAFRSSNQKTTPFIVRNSRFVGNESGRGGGALALFEVDAKITDSVFINNKASMAAAIQIGNNNRADSSLTLSGNTFDSNQALRFPVMTANIRGAYKASGNRVIGKAGCKIGKIKNCGKGFVAAKSAPDDAETQADVAVEQIPELLLKLCQVAQQYKFKGLGFHDGSVLLSKNCPK